MAKVCGFQSMVGTSRKTGNPYSGYLIFYTEPLRARPNAYGAGVAADSVFVSETLLNGVLPEVGQEIELHYDKRGYLVDVILA